LPVQTDFGEMKTQSYMKRNTVIKTSLLGLAVTAATALSAYADQGDIKMKLSDCPAAVQQTLTANAGGAQITEVTLENENGKLDYEADVKTADGKKEIKAAPDGTLLKADADQEEDQDKTEKQVKLSDCPAAVQKTLAAAVAAGGQITEVSLETKDGKSVYEADVKTTEGKQEIQVAPDGKLIKVKAGGDDDKDSNAGGDDDKD
jgi:uncharacterized membrane protein YkoI